MVNVIFIFNAFMVVNVIRISSISGKKLFGIIKFMTSMSSVYQSYDREVVRINCLLFHIRGTPSRDSLAKPLSRCEKKSSPILPKDAKFLFGDTFIGSGSPQASKNPDSPSLVSSLLSLAINLSNEHPCDCSTRRKIDISEAFAGYCQRKCTGRSPRA